jgi:hypothetical protein
MAAGRNIKQCERAIIPFGRATSKPDAGENV